MLIDAHTHLTWFEPDEMEKQIATARQLGTRCFVEVASKAANAARVVAAANSRDDLYCGVAVHPMAVETYDSVKDVPFFKSLIRDHKKIVCIGECGLDYSLASMPHERAEKQRQLFRDMVRLAREVGLPLNLHTCKASANDLLAILKEEKAYEVGGMIHNFGGNLEQAGRYVDMGFYISVSVLIQHPLAERFRSVLKEIPLAEMVMDSDAPGAKLVRMSDSTEPYPYDMDKYSELRMLRYICDKLAQVKGVSVQYVEDITAKNVLDLFCITLDDASTVRELVPAGYAESR